jgi:toxin FitB
MMLLLDTVVISELRKPKPSSKVVAWLKAHQESDLYLSVVTLGEIQRGVTKARKTDEVFAQQLQAWLMQLELHYADRLLSVTPSIARRWGHLSATLGHDGADLLIAATALEHGLAVVTRNIKHFAPTGVACIDPFVL